MRKLDPKVVQEIGRLRAKGATFSEIKDKLGIGHSSIHRYTRKVSILPQYIQKWKEKQGGSKKRAEKRKREALAEARKQLKKLEQKDWLIALATLYWAEGTKRDLSFSNTDGEMITFFVNALGKVFGIKKKELRVTIRIYEDLDKKKCLAYWAEKVGIPDSQILNVNILKGKKQGKLNYGMCRVRVQKGGGTLVRMHAYAKVLGELGSTPYSLMDKARVS